jgi:hypothetical protein
VNIHRRQSKPDFLRRLLATGCAALVFTLGLMSASPAFHAWVHHAAADAHHAHDGSSPANSEKECVVVWFAQGVSLALNTAVVAAVPLVWRRMTAPVVDELLLVTPYFWLRPERGPPAC